MLNELRAYLNAKIKEATAKNSYYLRANDEAAYPYSVITLSGNPSNDFVRNLYQLKIEIWSKDSKDSCDMCDALTFLDGWIDNTDNFNISIYKDTEFSAIDDTNRDLIRMVGSFSVHVVRR